MIKSYKLKTSIEKSKTISLEIYHLTDGFGVEFAAC